MKNFSKALVLSVAMLVSGNAFAITYNQAGKDVKAVAAALNMPVEVYNPKKAFLGKNKEGFVVALQNHIIGDKLTEAQRTRIAKMLVVLKAEAQAALKANPTQEALDFVKRIDNLLARINNENRFKKAYVNLVYNGDVCKLEKREARKIAIKAVLNKKATQAAA
jgi:hypothetical protein